MTNDEGEFFDLLTDALRSGPGGPSWPRAVERLRALNGSAQGHEHRLLLEVRRRLEEAKPLGQIQPSPQMTRRVFARLAAEAADGPTGRPAWMLPRGKNLALLALAAAFIIVSVAGLVLQAMLGGSAFRPSTVFIPQQSAPIVLAGFQSFESGLPLDWQPIGALRVRAERGLRLARGVKVVDQFGGLVRSEPLPAGQPLKLQATLRLLDGSSVSPEFFVTDEADFAAERPAGQRHELVWTLMDNRPQVRLPDQTVIAAGEPLAAGSRAISVEIKLSGGAATVQTTAGGHKLGCWIGMSSLATDKPWRLGIRFVVHGQNHDDCVAVDTVRVIQR